MDEKEFTKGCCVKATFVGFEGELFVSVPHIDLRTK